MAEHRGSDTAPFSKPENQRCLSILSDYGELRFPRRSDLHTVAQEIQQDPPTAFDAIAYDSAALVHFIPTNQIATFDEYANCVFAPHNSAIRDMYKGGCSLGHLLW